MKSAIRIAVVEDQTLVRQGIVALLGKRKDFSVQIEASNGIDLLNKLHEPFPDIVITDIEMPEMDGLKLTKKLKKDFPAIKVIVLTQYDDDVFIAKMAEYGASGFLLKDYDIRLLFDAIDAVYRDQYYFNERVSMALVRKLMQKETIRPKFRNTKLTSREKEILYLISNEYTTKEIGEKLCISVRTVDGHRERIIRKLGVKNIIGAVMYAYGHYY